MQSGGIAPYIMLACIYAVVHKIENPFGKCNYRFFVVICIINLQTILYLWNSGKWELAHDKSKFIPSCFAKGNKD